MTIVIIWQFFLVSELNSCERRIFLVYFYCHMSTLRIKWETYITRDRHTLLVHCVENSLNFKMSYDIWKLTKCSSTYNHLFTVLSFLRKLITIPMGGKGLNNTCHVHNLTRSLVGKNHHVFVDNFFNSLALAEDLLRDQIYVCGTVRGNRQGIPCAIAPSTQRVKRLCQGESLFLRKENIVVTVWKDKKPIYFFELSVRSREEWHCHEDIQQQHGQCRLERSDMGLLHGWKKIEKVVALSHVVLCWCCHCKCLYFGKTVPASLIKNPTGLSFRSCEVTYRKFFGTAIVCKFWAPRRRALAHQVL